MNARQTRSARLVSAAARSRIRGCRTEYGRCLVAQSCRRNLDGVSVNMQRCMDAISALTREADNLSLLVLRHRYRETSTILLDFGLNGERGHGTWHRNDRDRDSNLTEYQVKARKWRLQNEAFQTREGRRRRRLLIDRSISQQHYSKTIVAPAHSEGQVSTENASVAVTCRIVS